MLRIVGNVGRLDNPHVVHVDDAVLIVCLADGLDGPDLHVNAGDHFGRLGGVLHGGDVADNQGAAALIDRLVRQGLDGDLRAVAEGVPHGDA